MKSIAITVFFSFIFVLISLAYMLLSINSVPNVSAQSYADCISFPIILFLFFSILFLLSLFILLIMIIKNKIVGKKLR